jgi:hypothetical protein
VKSLLILSNIIFAAMISCSKVQLDFYLQCNICFEDINIAFPLLHCTTDRRMEVFLFQTESHRILQPNPASKIRDLSKFEFIFCTVFVLSYQKKSNAND